MKKNSSPLWYPYQQHKHMKTPLEIKSASGVYLECTDGAKLIDGISSWWCAIHGYNHPQINRAITDQVNTLAHVMLGGLTHKPAKELAAKLVEISPAGLEHVFFADSGSVGCEIAMKMAIQFWKNQNNSQKTKFLALNRGYHGDTFGAMAVGNPEDDCPSMHSVFTNALVKNIFIAEPKMGFIANKDQLNQDIKLLKNTLELHHKKLAAFILEPIMQGAGGFNFYAPEYLIEAKKLCQHYDVLLIFDEVATGFGRTGKLFASNHAEICPDIMVLAKALTAGYCGHSATLTTADIFNQFYSDNSDHALMHGPTFMANPTACRVALTSIDIFMSQNYLEKIKHISTILID
jgi:adenosylmethionine---8-amino-7-oxononanoate aminotransferase